MDEQLKQLIEAVCQQPRGSQEWRKAMHRLLIELQRLPGIKTSPHPDYLEALNKTWKWVSQNICQEFVPRDSLQTSLVKWINGYLHWRIRDLYSSNQDHLSLDVLIENEQKNPLIEQIWQTNTETITLNGLDSYIEQIQRQQEQHIVLALELYIERDPQNKLLLCYPKGLPHCNCQLLCQRRYLQNPPHTFSSIAKELNVPITKLTNHWYSGCKTLLQRIALDLGYQPKQEDE